MSNKIIGLIVCVVLLGGLLGFYFYNANKPEPVASSSPAPTEEFYSFVDFEADALNSVEFTNPDGTFSLLKDQAGVWSVPSKNTFLNQANADTIANNFCGMYSSMSVKEIKPESFKEYGLNPPQATVTGKSADKTETFHIGYTTTSKEYYYFLHEGDNTVYLLSTSSGENYFKTNNWLVDKTLPELAVEYMTYAYIGFKGKPEIEMTLKEMTEAEKAQLAQYGMAGNLKMVKPVKNKDIYTNNFNQMFVEHVKALQIGDLVDLDGSNASKYGFDDPSMKLVFNETIPPQAEGMKEEKLIYELIVGKDTDESGKFAYCKLGGNPHVFQLETAQLKPIADANYFKYIDKFVSLVNINELNTLKITTPKGTYETKVNHTVTPPAKEGEQATDIFAPEVNGQPIQEKAFKTFYQVVLGILYESVLEPPIAPSTAPVVTVTYIMDSGVVTTDKYYEYDDNFYVVAKGNEKAHFLVAKRTVDQVEQFMEKMLAGELNE